MTKEQQKFLDMSSEEMDRLDKLLDEAKPDEQGKSLLEQFAELLALQEIMIKSMKQGKEDV